MVPQSVVSGHAPVEITKLLKVGLRYAVLEAEVCFGIFNGMKGQIIQRKAAVPGMEVSLSYCCYYYSYYNYYYFYYSYYVFIYSLIITFNIKICNNFVNKIYKTNKITT